MERSTVNQPPQPVPEVEIGKTDEYLMTAISTNINACIGCLAAFVKGGARRVANTEGFAPDAEKRKGDAGLVWTGVTRARRFAERIG
jgi:hypothetical protein